MCTTHVAAVIKRDYSGYLKLNRGINTSFEICSKFRMYSCTNILEVSIGFRTVESCLTKKARKNPERLSL
jgi:hypothetical protein